MMKNLYAYICLLALCTSCSFSTQDHTSENENMADAFGTYQGTLPCADCEGIDFQLTLSQEQYKTRSVYLGKSATPLIDSGKWHIEDDSVIVLEKLDPGQNKFVVHGQDELQMLDQEGNIISGNLSASYRLEKSQPVAKETTPPAGIEFRATGNEPFWSMSINYDHQLYFNILDKDSVTISVPEAEQDGKEQKFEAETPSGPLQISIIEEACIDDMSGRESTHSVTVTLNGDEYKGCGAYLTPDKMAYEGQWTLITFKDKNFLQQPSENIPKLVIQNKTTLSGTSGCNQLTGQVSVHGDSIQFGQIAATKKACPGNFERDFLKALRQVNTYKVQEEQFILNSDDEVLMVFGKNP